MRERKLAKRGGGWAHRPQAKKIKQLTSEQASCSMGIYVNKRSGQNNNIIIEA